MDAPSSLVVTGNTPEELITSNIEIWTSAIQTRSSAGRGSRKKFDLYGIKKLRELILELAVQGKLVPQNPNDEPASALLERIAVEKARLVRDGKLKKQKTLPDITDDEKPEFLPVEWEVVRLGDIMNVLNGRAYKKHEMLKQGTPLLRVGNLFTSNEWYYSDLHLEAEKYIDTGDLIYAWSASFGPFIWDGGKVIYHYHIWKLDLYQEASICKKYLYNYLLAATKSIKASGNGIAMIHMTKERMEKLILPIPPLAEQHRIVAKVDEMMALCDQLEQQTEASVEAHATLVETLLATLTNNADAAELEQNWTRIAAHFDTLFTTDHSIDQLKQTVLQLAVMGKLVPQDPSDESAAVLLEKIAAEKARLVKEKKIKKQKKLSSITEDEKPFSLPESWRWCRVWDVAMLITSGSRDWAKYYSEAGAIFVTMGNLARNDYRLRLDKIRYVNPPEKGEGLRTKLVVNDLLISITGDVGNLGLIPNNFDDAYINQHICLLRFMPTCQNRYFPELMRSPWAKFQFDAPQRGIKNSFRLGDVGEMIIPVPPLREQERIVNKIDQLMTLCDQLKNRLQKSQEIKLHLADAMGERIFSNKTKFKSGLVEETGKMKISTQLLLGDIEADESALISILLKAEDGAADAKEIWRKSKLELSDFYKQLKKEIAAGYIAKPAKAGFSQ